MKAILSIAILLLPTISYAKDFEGIRIECARLCWGHQQVATCSIDVVDDSIRDAIALHQSNGWIAVGKTANFKGYPEKIGECGTTNVSGYWGGQFSAAKIKKTRLVGTVSGEVTGMGGQLKVGGIYKVDIKIDPAQMIVFPADE